MRGGGGGGGGRPAHAGFRWKWRLLAAAILSLALVPFLGGALRCQLEPALNAPAFSA
jgi:hypothetical protein